MYCNCVLSGTIICKHCNNNWVGNSTELKNRGDCKSFWRVND
jgi:hypothetical protein